MFIVAGILAGTLGPAWAIAIMMASEVMDAPEPREPWQPKVKRKGIKVWHVLLIIAGALGVVVALPT